MFEAKPITDCASEGREAFRKFGVTGYNRHSYQDGTPQQIGFQNGFSMEHGAACERALTEARAYHELSVRDNAQDREWAERLATAPNA